MRRSATLVFRAAFTLPVLLGACSKGGSTASSPSSSSTSSPGVAAYVKLVCATMSGYSARINQETSDFKSKESGVSDLATARSDLVEYLHTAASETDSLVGSIQAAGTPPVPNGATEEAQLVSGLQTVAGAFTDAAEQASKLPVDDPQAFAAGAAKIGAAISKDASGVDSTLSGLHDSRLDAAFSVEPACAPLKG